MKSIYLTVLLSLSYALGMAQPYITIYESGNAAVSEIRKLELQGSYAELNDFSENVDLKSLQFTGSSIVSSFEWVIPGPQKNHHLAGELLTFTNSSGTSIQGKLVRWTGNQIILEKNEQQVMIPDISEYRITVDGSFVTDAKPMLRVQASQARGTKEVQMVYELNGLSWSAEYVGRWDGNNRLIIEPWALINNNTDKTIDRARVTLISGNPNRSADFSSDKRFRMMAVAEEADAGNRTQLQDYFAIDLPNMVNLAQSDLIRVRLSDDISVAVDMEYRFNASLVSNDFVYGDIVLLADGSAWNKRMGERAQGTIKVFENVQGRFVWIGSDAIKRTSGDEETAMRLGKSAQVRMMQRVLDINQISKNIREEVIEVQFENLKNERVLVSVEKRIGRNGEIISGKWKRKDAETIEARFEMKPKSIEKLPLKLKFEYKN